MAYTEQLPRTGILAELIRRLVEAARTHSRFAARRHKAGRCPGGTLDANTLRDIGACRAYQDYASSAAVSAGSERRPHRIADSACWASLR